MLFIRFFDSGVFLVDTLCHLFPKWLLNQYICSHVPPALCKDRIHVLRSS